MAKERTGGQILVDALKVHGTDTVFCVPGESYLAALDAFFGANALRVITCRQEGGAAFMAESYGKLTGKPGICFVTRGPGACNASIGVHTAMQDSTPMILLVGQVAREQKGREAFQEIDYRQMFAPPITKWAAEIDDAKRLPEMMARAFSVAMSGRPGPVVLSLPEDMLTDCVAVADTEKYTACQPEASAADVKKALSLLARAQKPLVIVGGSGWTDKAAADFESFAAHWELPVVTGFRRQDAFSNEHKSYAGVLGTTVDPRLVARVKEADVVLAVGTRLSEMVTQGYTLFDIPVPKQKLIHVYPDSGELGRVYQPEVAVLASSASFAAAVRGVSAPSSRKWQKWTKALHADYQDWITIKTTNKFTLDMDGVYKTIIEKLPKDAVITTDAGNFSGWAQRFLSYSRPRRLLAPTSGAMGYGAPAAIAASLIEPKRTAVGFMGDGGFMMTGQEMATVAHHGAKPILIVCNNGMYGTIRMHQEKHYPGRTVATDLTNPDFEALGKAYGFESFSVEKTKDFPTVFDRALKSKKPVLIELKMDSEQITTTKKMSEIAAPAPKKRKA